MIAGGSEAAVTPVFFGAFCSMRAMATTFNDDPKRGSRPFDKDRAGFVMGEGAGVVVLETEEHALARGATIYCEVCWAQEISISICVKENGTKSLSSNTIDLCRFCSAKLKYLHFYGLFSVKLPYPGSSTIMHLNRPPLPHVFSRVKFECLQQIYR